MRLKLNEFDRSDRKMPSSVGDGIPYAKVIGWLANEMRPALSIDTHRPRKW
jgi:hypothetical protein